MRKNAQQHGEGVNFMRDGKCRRGKGKLALIAFALALICFCFLSVKIMLVVLALSLIAAGIWLLKCGI